MKSPVVKRSIILAGHKTSVSLEDAFWTGMKEIASGRNITLSDLVGSIDAQRQHGNLSSALRLFVLNHYRGRLCDMEARYGIREMLSHPGEECTPEPLIGAARVQHPGGPFAARI